MKPAIVILHGAWHTPAHYDLLTSALQTHGFDVHVLQLPTASPEASQRSFNDDVAAVQALVGSLADASRSVIVISHSYGGAVATQALRSLSATVRQRAGQRGGVVHLVYMCAFMLRPGETPLSVSMPRPDPEVIAMRDNGTIVIDGDPVALFYHDVEPGLARKSADMLVPHSANGTPEVTETAWKEISSTYIVCTQDRMLRIEWQHAMIEAAKAEGAEVDVVTLDAAHSPFLNKPQEVADAVEKVAVRYA